MKPNKGERWEKSGTPQGQRPLVVMVDACEDGFVSYHACGGGWCVRLPEESFIANHSKVADDYKPDLTMDFFFLDDGTCVYGWTRGRRWNGWECPLLEKSTIIRLIEKVSDLSMWFEGDVLVYDTTGYIPGDEVEEEEEEERVMIHPFSLSWDGVACTVYDMSDLCFCWWSGSEEEEGEVDDRLAAICPYGINNPLIK